MVGWLKRIFGSTEDEEPEVQEETVELSELSSWVDARSESEYSKIQPKVESQITKLHEERTRLKGVLKELATAELHNKDIPERERQIMEGNREAYIRQHKQFIMQIDITEGAGCGEVARFCKDFEEMLVALAKSTAKGHAVMGAFFANHAADVNKSIKTMGDTVSKMRELLEDGNVGVDYIDDVRKAVNALKAKKKLLKEMDDELDIYQQKLSNSKQMKEKIEKQIESLKQTDSYSEYSKANEEREALWKKVKQAEEEIEQMFSPLSRAMKKYERIIIEDPELFSKYLDNPVKALALDEDAKIVSILQKMKQALATGSLELKDAEKVVGRIDEVARDKLCSARDSYIESKSAIKKIDDTMRNSRVLNDLDDLKYKIEHVDNQIQILHDKIENAEKTKAKIDLESLREEAAEKIKDAFGIEVTITWPDNP